MPTANTRTPRRLLRPLPGGGFAWAELGSGDRPGPVRSGLPAPSARARLWLAVPAEDVLLLSVPRPPGGPRQWRKALPFVVEDRLAGPVESQHVAWIEGEQGACLSVAVVERARMSHWLATLAEAGLEADALVPEPLLLPWSAGRPSLLVEDGRALLRHGPMQAFCGRAEEITSLGLVEPAALETIPAERALPRMTEMLAGPPPLNLLQGEFAAARWRSGIRPWRRVAVLALAALGLSVLHAATEHWILAGKVAAQRQEMTALYLRAVPGAIRVVDPEQQLRQAMAGGTSGDSPLVMLAGVAPALAAAAGIGLDAIDYRAGQLDLVLLAPDVASLDALRARLQSGGLRAELTAATPGTRGVEGRLSLRAGAP